MHARRCAGFVPVLTLVLGLPVMAMGAAGAGGDDSPLQTRTLANGVEVLVYPDAVVPLVTVELVVRNGSTYETPASNGLAHLFEHLFWPDFRSAKFAASGIKDRGISFNATTQEEKTNFFLIAPKEGLRTSMVFLRDAAGAPDFSFGRLDAQKAVVLEEIRRAQANPYTLMTRRTNELLFPKNKTFRNPLGTEAVVENASARQLQAMHNRFMAPGNLAVVVTGDVEPGAAFQLAAEVFGGLVPEVDAVGQGDPGEGPKSPAGEIIVSPQVQDVVFRFAWRGPGVESDRTATFAADVLSEILRQPGSRFQRTLVDSGLLIGTDVTYYTQRRVGISSIVVKCSPARAKQALRAVEAEIAALDSPDYFSDRELEDAREAVIADELFAREDLVRYSHSLGFWWASAGTDYLAERFAATRRIGRADVTAYVRRYLQAGVRAVVAVVPEDRKLRADINKADLLAP